jgi:hypothetical protein
LGRPSMEKKSPAGSRAMRDLDRGFHPCCEEARARRQAKPMASSDGLSRGHFVRIVRAPRAGRDVDQGRCLADEGDSCTVSIDVAGGGFADQLPQCIAKTETRAFTNVGHGGSLHWSFVWPAVSAVRSSLFTKSRADVCCSPRCGVAHHLMGPNNENADVQMLLMRMAHPRRRAWRRRSQFSALKRAIESNQVGDFGTAFKSACHTSKNTSLVRFPLQFRPDNIAQHVGFRRLPSGNRTARSCFDASAPPNQCATRTGR